MDYELWSNGVAMHSHGWAAYEFENRRSLPIQRTAEIYAFGQEGSSTTFGGVEPTSYVLKMWVDHHHPTTGVAGGRAQHEANVSAVAGLFAHRGEWTLSQKMPDATMRYARVRTRSFEDVEAYPGGELPLTWITAVLDNPSGWWTDRTTPATHNSTTFGTVVELPEFVPAAAKGPLTDAVLTFWGAGSNIKFESGDAWIRHVGPLSSNEYLVIDCGRMRATRINGVTTEEVSALRDLSWSGGVGMFDINTQAGVKVTATGGTSWRIQGYPKYN